MTSYKVHVVFVVPAVEEQDAEAEIYNLLDAHASDLDFEITEIWDFDEDEDLEEENEWM